MLATVVTCVKVVWWVSKCYTIYKIYTVSKDVITNAANIARE